MNRLDREREERNGQVPIALHVEPFELGRRADLKDSTIPALTRCRRGGQVAHVRPRLCNNQLLELGGIYVPGFRTALQTVVAKKKGRQFALVLFII